MRPCEQSSHVAKQTKNTHEDTPGRSKKVLASCNPRFKDSETLLHIHIQEEVHLARQHITFDVHAYCFAAESVGGKASVKDAQGYLPMTRLYESSWPTTPCFWHIFRRPYPACSSASWLFPPAPASPCRWRTRAKVGALSCAFMSGTSCSLDNTRLRA